MESWRDDSRGFTNALLGHFPTVLSSEALYKTKSVEQIGIVVR
jgi:hypothetical protein